MKATNSFNAGVEKMSAVRLENAIKYLEMWSRQKKYGKLVISFTNGTITSVRYENVMTDEQIIGELGSGRKIHVRRIESTE